jgi:hypothetical protein
MSTKFQVRAGLVIVFLCFVFSVGGGLTLLIAVVNSQTWPLTVKRLLRGLLLFCGGPIGWAGRRAYDRAKAKRQHRAQVS